MKTDACSSKAADFVPVDELEKLELKIARRADALSKQSAYDPQPALENWLQAESEILGDFARRGTLLDS
jgi:hypothetical protein